MGKKLLAILLAVSLLVSLCGCGNLFLSDEDRIRNRMEAFEKAYNAGDMEKCLECLDSKTRNQYSALVNIGNALIGKTGFKIAIADMFALGVAVMDEGDVLAFENLDITIKSGDTAVVKATMAYTEHSDTTKSTVTFKLVKEDGDGYIVD